jgi:DNA-binding XRE family transcriptional regulator
MKLFEARARRRATQWDLRKLTGIHQSKISLIERGYVDPSPVEKSILAKALGFKVDDVQWEKVNA